MSSDEADGNQRSAERSQAIDRQIKSWRTNASRCYRLLLAGDLGSKSAFWRQVAAGPYLDRPMDTARLEAAAPRVRAHVVELARLLIDKSVRLGGDFLYRDASTESVRHIQHDFPVRLALVKLHAFTSRTIVALNTIWNDAGIRKTWEQNNDGDWWTEDARHFFERSHVTNPAIGDLYCPTEGDVVSCRAQTNGIFEHTLMYRGIRLKIIERRCSRGERKKWIHFFENVNAVVFFASMNGFDQGLLEDGTTNRLDESLSAFRYLVNNSWFQEIPIILFLDKKDLLVEKLQRVRFADFFPEYEGDNSYQSVTEYVRNMFTEKAPNRYLYTHFTGATDVTPQLQKLFASLNEFVIQTALKRVGSD